VTPCTKVPYAFVVIMAVVIKEMGSSGNREQGTGFNPYIRHEDVPIRIDIVRTPMVHASPSKSKLLRLQL
jgi:hypothetical protein